RDLPEDERIGIIAGGLFTIMRKHFRFHVALYKSQSTDSERRNSEWNVELHAKCGRRQNHGANWGRVIVDPGCDGDGGETVREHDHVFDRDAELPRNMTRKDIHIFDYIVNTLCRAAFSRGTSMTARVPRKDCDVVEA